MFVTGDTVGETVGAGDGAEVVSQYAFTSTRVGYLSVRQRIACGYAQEDRSVELGSRFP